MCKTALRSQMLHLQINGEPREVASATIAELLTELRLPERGIAVAVNSAVIRRHDHASHALQPGDRIEIIRAVQGG